MSKNKPKNKNELPSLPKKYVNERKIEELEKIIFEVKIRNDKLLDNIRGLQTDIKLKETENVKSILAYDYKIEDYQKQVQAYEQANSQLQVELENIREEITNHYKDKIQEIKLDFDKKYSNLMNDYDSEKDKCHKYKAKKKEYKQEVEDLKSERTRLNETLISTINKYEETIKEIKHDYDNQIRVLKLKEEDYLKEKETLNENEIYGVYQELKNRFERNLNELKVFKDENNKINDENKIFKLTMESSDNILKECAKIQLQKQKILNQYKDSLKQQNEEMEKMTKQYEEGKTQIIEIYSKAIKDKSSELAELKMNIEIMKQENKKLKSLSQMILDQRSEVEMFFIESLEDIKQEIYKKKKQEQRKRTLFPTISRKYDNPIENMSKISISDLSLEDKEKMLKLLFSKINEKSKPKGYRDFSSFEHGSKYKHDLDEISKENLKDVNNFDHNNIQNSSDRNFD